MDNNLLRKITIRIFDTTGLLPANMVQGRGDYIINDVITTPFLNVVCINPLQTSTKKFMNDELANNIKLEAGLDQSEQVVIDIHRGFITVEIPRPASERGSEVYTSSNVPRGNGLRVPLGLDVLCEPVYFNFASETNTNLSFLGTPGSGKSVSQRQVIVSLVRNNNHSELKFLLLECAKNALDLRIFSSLPHLVHPVISNPEEAESALGFVVAQVRRGKLPFRLVVVIDEVAELIRQRPQTIDLLMTLVSQGRAQNVINLLATQVSDRDTLGNGKAVFRQIHNSVLGKISNKQMSYVLGNKAGLGADSLVGKGDLKLSSVDNTTRFAGIFCGRDDIERLPRVEKVQRLPLAHYANTEAIIDEAKAMEVYRGAPVKEIPPSIVAEGLMSLQRQVSELEYRNAMRGREYYILPASRVKELGRNPATFKERDQPQIKAIYQELWKRGLRLCKR